MPELKQGGSLPSLDTLLKMAKVFNVSPNELLNNKFDENTPENLLKSDIYDILSLAKKEQLELIKKLILSVIY